MEFFSHLTFPAVGSVADNHCRRQRPRYYGIQYNEAGRFQLQIDGGKIWELSGPWVFITHPGSEFFYQLNPAERHFYTYICFYGSRVRSYLDSGLLDLSPHPIKILRHQDFSRSIQAMQDWHENRNFPRMIWQLEDLLLQLNEQNTQTRNLQNDSYWGNLREQIMLHPEIEWNFMEEAQKQNISIQHFRRCFRTVFGNSPRQFVITLRMEQAALLLRNSRLPIKEIAAKCGIDDMFYFSCLFKKKYRLPPTAYRREFYRGEIN